MLMLGEARGSRRRRLERVTTDRRPRTAVVLGAGGVVGHAFHVGVLSALADEFGWDARQAELIVGTSAGSVVGASLRAGLGPIDQRRRLAGEQLSPEGSALVRRAEAAVAAATDSHDGDGGVDDVENAEEKAFGVIARLPRIASPARVRRALREPWRVTPGSLVSAVLRPGRHPTAHLRVPYDAMIGTSWPDADLWIVAVDLDVGLRVVFGRPDAPEATVGEAVEASCAIPGHFVPVTIDGARYVDGAVHSTTNADLVGDSDLRPDLVIVSAPMSAVGGAVPRAQTLSLRQLVRRQVAGEVAALRTKGINPVTFQPTADDLALMVGNSMDPAKASVVCDQVAESTRTHVREAAIAERLAPLRR
jgi:NTE family protein